MSNKKIVFLAPHWEMLHLAKSLVSHYENVAVRLGLLEQGVEEALAWKRRGEVEVFISREEQPSPAAKGASRPHRRDPVTVYDLIRPGEARRQHQDQGVSFNMIRGIEAWHRFWMWN